ncbi:hypothetical protein A1OS_22500 [Enterovibrio norvegicus]|nr:hypothetical protein A1OS_22500 [Enterovibrio norvegicus]
MNFVVAAKYREEIRCIFTVFCPAFEPGYQLQKCKPRQGSYLKSEIVPGHGQGGVIGFLKAGHRHGDIKMWWPGDITFRICHCAERNNINR